MQGVEGDAAEISALILDLAQSLKANTERESAAGSLKAIHAQLDQLLQQLPASFFRPLISKDSLSSAQVSLAVQSGLAQATATELCIATLNLLSCKGWWNVWEMKQMSIYIMAGSLKVGPHIDKLLPWLLVCFSFFTDGLTSFA